MNVDRDIIIDLLPAYAAGEASAATRALVEEHLRRDPDLAARVTQAAADPLAALPRPAAPAGLELETIRRTRRLLRRERLLFGWALFFSAVGLSFEFTLRDGHLSEAHWLMWDHPPMVAAGAVLALVCWILYGVTRRRAKATGF